jgi:hypothetical protein
MSIKKPTKPYWEMTTAELRDATREFETGDGGPAIKPSARAAAQQRRARHKRPGRPMVGKGAKRISVSIEGNWLRHIDQQARKMGLSRSAFIARAVEKQLAAAE